VTDLSDRTFSSNARLLSRETNMTRWSTLSAVLDCGATSTRTGLFSNSGRVCDGQRSARNTAWTPTLTWRRGPHQRPTSICGTGPERTDLNWILRSTADCLRNPDPETEVIRFGRVAAFGDCGKNPTGARRSLPPQLIRRQENVFPPMETNLSAETPGNQSLRPTGMLIACDESFRSQRTGARKHRRQGC
jgi:hypothetical protein